MLRLASDHGWWLITHPDHAHLAAAFAAHWGDSLFTQPQPRAEVLDAIRVHDDGWAARDAQPKITREGKPSAFSSELVGKYSAFEEIDLADYLSVRERALDAVEARCAYAALLVSMHTYNLLTERADRSTISAEQLPLLDNFLQRQFDRQQALRSRLSADSRYSQEELSDAAILSNFHLLQATDNLSLLSCVAYERPATLLHALPVAGGGTKSIDVYPLAARSFRLDPYPLDASPLTFEIRARHVKGKSFATASELRAKFNEAAIETLTITICE
jgi:hypothetical protein